MGDDQGAMPFWEEFDQRLHNLLPSAVSVVDHTRRLRDYYEADFPAIVAEYLHGVASRTDITALAKVKALDDGSRTVMQQVVAKVTQKDSLVHLDDGLIPGLTDPPQARPCGIDPERLRRR
jgi:hypothetical protein